SFFCSWIRVTSYYAISVCQVSRNPAISDHTRSNYGDVFNCSCCLLFIHVNPPFRVGFVSLKIHVRLLVAYLQGLHFRLCLTLYPFARYLVIQPLPITPVPTTVMFLIAPVAYCSSMLIRLSVWVS